MRGVYARRQKCQGMQPIHPIDEKESYQVKSNKIARLKVLGFVKHTGNPRLRAPEPGVIINMSHLCPPDALTKKSMLCHQRRLRLFDGP